MRRRRYRLSLLAVGSLFVPLLAVALPAGSAHAAEPTASFAKDQDWGTGYGGSYTITNSSTSALNNWTLEFDLPANNSVASLWNATYTTASSHVTVKPPSWQTSIAAGASYSVGFNIAYSGAYAPLKNCKLNGKPCDGSGSTTDTTAPSVPTGLRAALSGTNGAALSWTASTDNVGVTGYDVYDGSAKVATATGASITVTGLSVGSHTFTVVAFDAAGNRSAASASASVTVPNPPTDNQPPTAPGTPTVTATTSSTVALSWAAATDNVGVTAYDVYNGATIARTVTGTSATVDSLAADTSYTFTVKARDAAGNTSPASGAVTARTKPGSTDPGGSTTIGYFTQWSIYARGYSVKQLDTSGSAAKLTYLNYAFANIHPTTKQCFITNHAAGNDSDPNAGDGAGDAWADFGKGWDAGTSVAGTTDTWDQPLAGNFNQLKQLKAKYPNLKIQISIGGWSYSKWFSDAASTDASRKALVSSCIDMYIKGNLPVIDGRGGAGSAAGIFDGIDLDWEWPNSDGHLGNIYKPADKANYTLLAQEFRRQLDALGATTGKHYTLSAFLPADPAKISAGIDVPGLFGAFDFATIQGYDYHGAWETSTNQQSAIKLAAGDPSPANRQFSSEIAISAYVAGGAPKSKLTLGVPFYGRGWTGVPAGSTHGLFQTGTGPAPGTYENGYEDYHKLKDMAASGGYTIYRDPVAGYAYIYNGSVFYTYDDPTEIARKAAWIKSQGLAGAMVWSFDGDTANGELMTALANGLK